MLMTLDNYCLNFQLILIKDFRLKIILILYQNWEYFQNNHLVVKVLFKNKLYQRFLNSNKASLINLSK